MRFNHIKRSLSSVSNGYLSSGALWATLLVLSGCGCHDQLHEKALVTCQDLLERRVEATERRDAVRMQMQDDVYLGLHSVPGQTFDAVGQREAAAYVERVRERWLADDTQLDRTLIEINAELHAYSCQTR
jgi:hypothetical protein